MSKFGMGSKLWILSSKKTDGRYNQGKVVGVELLNHAMYFVGKSDFFGGFTIARYKVAYIDCFTGKGRAEWFNENDLQRDKPTINGETK